MDLETFIKANDFELQAITLTHGHLDHVGGTYDLAKSFPDAEILLHKNDENLYYGLPQQPLFMGIQPQQMKALGFDYASPPRLTRNWQDGEIYEVGNLRFSVRHCPGHTRGHVVLVEEAERKVFVGDCLFEGTIGRTDLPGGSYEQLIESITKNILVGAVFTVIGLWPLVFRGEPLRLWAIGVGGLLIAFGGILPQLLAPIHKGWM